MSITIPGPYNYPIVPYHSGSASTTIIESDPIYVSDSGSLATLGSNTFTGTQTFTGNLVPTVSSSFSLGTVNNPWKEIYISSGSLSIQSDTPGNPDAVITNKLGNLEISVGGMQLLGNGSFRASTGSFSYISGSITQVGDHIQTGTKTISGSLRVSGSSVFDSDVNVQSGFYHKGHLQFNYGQFYSLETQSGSADTAYAMKYEVTDGTDGVSITNNASGLPTRITPANTGVYNIQFSNQLGNTDNSDITFDIWFRINEVNVPNSNTKFSLIKSLGSGLYAVAALNFLTQLNAGQYVEIMWSCAASTGQFEYLGTQSTPTRPATPSIILTVTQIA